MRYVYTWGLAVLLGCSLQAADQKVLFGIFFNPDLYPQRSPKETLESAIGAIERDRIEYLLAHLLDPAVVDARMKALTPYFEKIAAEQISVTGKGMGLKGAELQLRVQERAVTLNFRAMADAVREKLTDEPANLKEMKLFLSDGQFAESGDSAQVTLKTIKDKSIFFKKIGDRWYIENRKEETPTPKQ